MKASPAVMLYAKVKGAIQDSGKPSLGFTMGNLADLMIPGGSQSDWAMSNVAKQLSLVVALAREEGIGVSPVNRLYFQVFPDGGGPTSLGGAIPFVPGGKGKATAGLVFETDGHWIMKATRTVLRQNQAIALINGDQENLRLEQKGFLNASEIAGLSREAYLALKN